MQGIYFHRVFLCLSYHTANVYVNYMGKHMFSPGHSPQWKIHVVYSSTLVWYMVVNLWYIVVCFGKWVVHCDKFVIHYDKWVVHCGKFVVHYDKWVVRCSKFAVHMINGWCVVVNL